MFSPMPDKIHDMGICQSQNIRPQAVAKAIKKKNPFYRSNETIINASVFDGETMNFKRITKILTMFCGLLLANACENNAVPAVTYFEHAEQAYKAGQYEVAHQNYNLFLKQNPDPQLARLAERRILSIEREIESVLGQKAGPKPAYVYQDDNTGNTPLQHPGVLYKSERPIRMPYHD